MNPDSTINPPAPIDGRRRRREQGRLAVIDAMIDLVFEGYTPPSVEQVAERSGVSQASVFRYFNTLDDLRHDGIQRYFDRYSDLMAIPEIGEGTLDNRIERLVEARVAYHETTEPMARLARRQATVVPEVETTLARIRSTLLDQLSQHFDEELSLLQATARKERLAVVAALTSFESWDQLRGHGFTSSQLNRVLRQNLDRLLQP